MHNALTALVLCFLLSAGCSAATSSLTLSTTAANGTVVQIPATILKPDGPGPFPAVVIMHDCSGLGPRSSGAPMRWARELVENGYAIVMPDSFTARGHAGGVCTNPSPSRNDVAPSRRAPDAYAALAYLRTLPYVDGSRIGIMGGSHGGSTTLASIVAPDTGKGTACSREADGFQRGSSSLSRLCRSLRGLARRAANRRKWSDHELCRRVQTRSAAIDPDRRKRRLDTGGAVPQAD